MKITFVKDKDCKHSVRFAAQDPKAPIQSIYVNREFCGDGSTPLVVTVDRGEAMIG